MPTRQVLCLLLASGVLLPAQELRDIVRKALAGLNASEARMPDFGFIRYGERKEFNPDGSVKSTQTIRVKREVREGLLISHVLERNGAELSSDERKKAEAAIARRLAELRSITPEQRRKQAEEARKKQQAEDEWIQEIPEALDFKLAGEEAVGNRPALVIDCSPRPGYQPKNLRARVLLKLRGRLWIDKADQEMVRAKAEIFDEVSVALGLAGHIARGAHFEIERAKTAGGVWMPTYQHARFSARILVFKSANMETVSRYSEYVRLRNTVQTAAR